MYVCMYRERDLDQSCEIKCKHEGVNKVFKFICLIEFSICAPYIYALCGKLVDVDHQKMWVHTQRHKTLFLRNLTWRLSFTHLGPWNTLHWPHVQLTFKRGNSPWAKRPFIHARLWEMTAFINICLSIWSTI